MYECYMNDVIHESIYDICTNIYDSICYNNNNCHDNKDVLIQDLNNFIENEIEKLSVYDINNILICYGIDNAYNFYVDNLYKNIYPRNYDIANKFSISKVLINTLLISSFEIR